MYEFTCLPFGLSTSPFVFTKILKPVVNYLRNRGFLSTIYLDDFLCIGKNALDCLNNVQVTRKLFNKLGLIINEEKSSHNPSTSCKYLGFIIDSKDMTLNLPIEKKTLLTNSVREFLHKEKCKIREFARLIGLLIAACPAVPYGWLYTKVLEREKFKALIINDYDFNKTMLIPSFLQGDLNWWLQNIPIAKNPIRQFRFEKEIFSDASLTGWGAHCNEENIGGFWSSFERNRHINHLEIIAAFLALKSFAQDCQNCEILLRIDNTTAIAYINKMGSVQYPELNKLARSIWLWCEERKLCILHSFS